MIPNYRDGNLVNLIASIIRARGGKARHATLAALPQDELEAARNLVFFLVDGLGYNYLADVGRGGALYDHLAGQLTSVYPSTTAAAITTSFTGLTPAEHGLTGWHCWFPEAEVLAAPLPFRRRGDERPLDELGIKPAQLFDAVPIANAIDARMIVVTQSRIVESEYSRYFGGRAERHGYDGLLGLVNLVEAAVRSGTDRKYIYAYYPDFDTVSHQHGVESAQAASRLRAIDAAFAELLKRLSGTDTVIIVTADHGFVDTKHHEALEIRNYPGLVELLRLPLSGEPRVAFCHVAHGETGKFIERARALLGDCAEVRLSAELDTEGWFGDGAPHPRLAERIGDVTLMMRGRCTIKDHMPGEKRHLLIGNHGGASADEMLIPLVLARL